MKRGFILIGGVVLAALLAVVFRSATDRGVEENGTQKVGSHTPLRAQGHAAGETGGGLKAPSINVQVVIDPAAGSETRLEAMSRLGCALPPDDIAVLMEFLRTPMPESARISVGAYNAVRNDLYEVLLRQQQLPEGLGSLLVDVVGHTEREGMWRNYCIQFMQPFYERAASERGSASVAAEMERVRESLWSALAERENANASTALLGLERLSRTYPEFDRSEVNRAMLDLAADEQASMANRITAIRLCGETGNTQAAVTARDMAFHGGTVMLRCAAIATLGEIGRDADTALLQELASSGEERIRSVAQGKGVSR